MNIVKSGLCCAISALDCLFMEKALDSILHQLQGTTCKNMDWMSSEKKIQRAFKKPINL